MLGVRTIWAGTCSFPRSSSPSSSAETELVRLVIGVSGRKLCGTGLRFLTPLGFGFLGSSVSTAAGGGGGAGMVVVGDVARVAPSLAGVERPRSSDSFWVSHSNLQPPLISTPFPPASSRMATMPLRQVSQNEVLETALARPKESNSEAHHVETEPAVAGAHPCGGRGPGRSPRRWKP